MIGLFDLIHSVDSLELAQEIDRRSGEAGRRQNILQEVNIGRVPTKAGFHPDDVVRSVPPPTDDPDLARPYFRKLHDLARQIAVLDLPAVRMDELSMGMSNDYEVAIEEGATLVRVGTAIFGACHV